jgi:hypothetical protein
VFLLGALADNSQMDLFLQDAAQSDDSQSDAVDDGTAPTQTRIYFSTYDNLDAEPKKADMFVVLDYNNLLAVQTSNRSAALSRIYEERTRAKLVAATELEEELEEEA